jgi:hypothetical protein
MLQLHLLAPISMQAPLSQYIKDTCSVFALACPICYFNAMEWRY